MKNQHLTSISWGKNPVLTRSKRFLEIQQLRERKKTAISLVKATAKTKFVETIEAHFCLNIDPKYNDQQFRATTLIRVGFQSHEMVQNIGTLYILDTSR
ncbi:hypothetical protein Ahy_B04g072949 [Arachis hypogaea]|uniref:Uncharacterized protein n=1 Tax=Arachis hypogaea TaxID=3818 RepID=A0A444ZPB5_ARAHY|nr:hypothetical protein Ahy_B04g072949 [Arachis hypogaea]